MKAMKARKGMIAVTSLCILLPVIAGVILWGRLPERVPTHFNFEGVADGWSGKPFAVFGLPLMVLAIHLACIFGVSLDPKRENVPGKIFALVLWICPAVSLFGAALTYSGALGYPLDVPLFSMLLTGLMFVIVGNYLPKCRQNYTVGIKLPWTLSDEDNWNRTHRLAGPLWVAAGVVTILAAFVRIGQAWVIIAALTAAVLVPVIYSAALYLKKRG